MPARSNVGSARWLDWIWAACIPVLLVSVLYANGASELCAYMGTDFRGYYTSAQIALQQGFAGVYDQNLQSAYQIALTHPCAPASLPPMARVSMPYLPVFVLLFLPFSQLEFTASYLVWTAVNLLVLVFYLLRFTNAAGVELSPHRLLQWVACLPVIVTLYLGQVNVVPMICLGEFTLALLRDRQARGGLWLSGMLLKPQTMFLLLPGLLLSRSWGAMIGFAAGALVVFCGSLAVAGAVGVWASLSLVSEFAGPLIQTAATMMNWRALALNLSLFLPGWAAWAAAIAGMVLVASVILLLWLRWHKNIQARPILLVLATCAGTLTVAWHSHFYLLTILIPLLVYLDARGHLPVSVRASWLFGPPLLYMVASLIAPTYARNWMGMGMLALGLYLFTWSARQLVKSPSLVESETYSDLGLQDVQPG